MPKGYRKSARRAAFSPWEPVARVAYALSVDAGIVLIIVVLVALPIGAIVFALGAGNAFSQIGKGDLSIEQDGPESSGSSMPPASPEERAA